MDKQEAIKILKGIHDRAAFISTKEAIETLLPELNESEDEKIRKWLIDTIKSVPNDSIEWDVINKSDVLAWLEKQGEKPINQPDFEIPFGAKDSELIEESYYIPKGYHAEISKDKVTIKKGEQEPTEFKWSADDKNKLLIIEQILNCADLLISSQELTEIKNWLNSLKQRIGG